MDSYPNDGGDEEWPDDGDQDNEYWPDNDAND